DRRGDRTSRSWRPTSGSATPPCDRCAQLIRWKNQLHGRLRQLRTRQKVRRMSERDAYEPGVPCWVTTLQPDPDAAASFYGAVFCLGQPRERHGAELVNEPGAWSMSRLDTPGPDGAAAFYGALFGWTTETFELDEATFTMFRLPGYVGGEPEQPVSREVVATMAPTDSGPARWGVDFWVGDVDAAAAAAE